ncbi:DUF2267 domain-containing protein, partial [filamentous cyanobacterium CCP5]
VYIILKKIDAKQQSAEPVALNFTQSDFTGMGLAKADILGHLDYLNQEQYIDAEFSGNAYGNQEDVPDVVNPDEVDIRVANTLGAEDGPLPHLVAFKRAALTDKGRNMLKDMKANPPKGMESGPKVPVLDDHAPFLEKVRVKGSLPDLYDARDITEVVFRVMRDVMTTEESDRIEAELHESALPTDEKAMQMEVADLWHDTNPLVSLVSRLRGPLKGEPPFGIDSELFLKRVDREGSVPKSTTASRVVGAVFAATKEELSPERIQEIVQWLPEGQVRQLWQQA